MLCHRDVDIYTFGLDVVKTIALHTASTLDLDMTIYFYSFVNIQYSGEDRLCDREPTHSAYRCPFKLLCPES